MAIFKEEKTVQEKKLKLFWRKHTDKLKEFLKTKKGKRVYVAVLISLGVVAAVSSTALIIKWMDYRSAQKGYEQLRELAPSEEDHPAIASDLSATDDDEEAVALEYESLEPSPELVNINADYIGWVRISGTPVDYPVTQANDNDKYMRTTFWGGSSVAGCIFMDYRCAGAFESPIAMIYGHNMRDSSMFTSLHKYRDGAYFANNPEVTVFTKDGGALSYRVFAAFVTETSEPVFGLYDADSAAIAAYFASHGAPEGATRFLVLSTCTGEEHENERMLVFAALQ